MIWGSKSYNGVVPLAIVKDSVTGEKYRRILQEHFLHELVAGRQRRRKATILQDDNASAHRASVVTS